MKNDILLVPMHLDALVLNTPQSVVQPKADFTKLPYFDGEQDRNSDRAYISEEILSQPFADQGLLLQAGVHLHWALPDTLTSTMSMPIVYREAFMGVFGETQGKELWQHLYDIRWLKPFASRDFWAEIQPKDARHATALASKYVDMYGAIESLLNHPAFLPAPNRWLVTRSGVGPTQAWVVESDYLFPNGEGADAGSISYPVHVEGSDLPPFRYLGRKVPHRIWREESHAKPQNYLDAPLTALGYGEPSFAAFYPNCHSVFGLYDNYTGPKENLRYQVIGWYSDPALDYLGHFLSYFADQYKAKHNQIEPSKRELFDAFQDEFKWSIGGGGLGTDTPRNIACYAEVAFASEPSEPESNHTAEISITVGNTGTEALSAYLAQEIGGSEQKALIEDQLEAAQLSSKLGSRQLDVGPKFYEARHEKGFTAVHAGTLWTVRTQSENVLRADATDAHAREQATLSAGMAHLLNEANRLQNAYDQAQHQLDSLRDQIFADWYKYQICAYPPEGDKTDYPDLDAVRDYIERRDLAYYDKLMHQTGVLALQQKSNGTIASDLSKQSGSTAAQLANALNTLWQALQTHNQQKTFADKNAQYVLQQVAAPRYWHPNEPSILLTGEGAHFTERLGQDGRHHPDDLLECQLLTDSSLQPDMAQNLARIQQEIEAMRTAAKASNAKASNFAFHQWTEQPWHPFMLEWSAEFFPAMDTQSNHHGHPLPQTYITDNYDLAPNKVDVTPKEIRYWKGANTYLGSAIVTPHSGKVLKAQLTGALIRLLRLDAYAATPSTIEETKPWLKENIGKVLSAYEAKLGASSQTGGNQSFAVLLSAGQSEIQALQKQLTEQLTKPRENSKNISPSSATRIALNAKRRMLQIVTLAKAYQQLVQTNAISQTLSGFNAGLLMQKQSLQLRAEDPLGFAEYQGFAQRVRKAVQTGKRMAPQPLNDFNPIRAGTMELLQLRLVDTFGRVQPLDHTDILTTEQLQAASHNVPVYLPPRLTQPARLNFRWLSAGHDDVETNDHPATSPICGWLLPNHLDNSIMVYSQAGEALGALVANDSYTPWRPAPGHDLRLTTDQIENPHLRQMVHFLTNQQSQSWTNRKSTDDYSTFLDNFLSVLDSASQNIEPENFAQHQSQALLMGQPIALVRAQLDVEVQGLLAHHQGWSAFVQDMQRIDRDTHGVENVQIPVRIGEDQQLNDGLVGYWIEDESGYKEKLFYAPQSNDETEGDGITDDLIVTHGEGDVNGRRMFNRLCTLNDQPLTLTMLLDPRGSVHATSGLLPTKAIHIPPDQYSKALERIEITFLTTPLLTAAGQVDLSMPKEPGYVWSWLERDGESWREIGTIGTLKMIDVQLAFPSNGRSAVDGLSVWERLREKGWIDVQADGQTALVRAQDQRTEIELGTDFKEVLPKIEDLLDSTHLGHFKPEAHFARQQEIREGWLKLRKNPVQDDSRLNQ